MTPERWAALQEIVERVSELSSEDRERELREYCTDPEMESEARRLLSNLCEAGDFLEQPHPIASAFRGEHSPKFEPGDRILARFEVIRLLGAGGMGEVYEVADHVVGERVALKTLRPWAANGPDAIERLRSELRRARKVTHPGVCRLHEFFETQDDHGQTLVFLTMELLSGEALAERLKRAGPVTSAEALSILEQVAAGLEAAHAAGIVHRDLKPGNIFLTGQEQKPRVVITDFGLAYRFAGSNANTSMSLEPMVAGTPGYMAPEQHTGSANQTAAVDVYAMGVIAHELLCGTRPSDAQPFDVSSRRAGPNWRRAIRRATAFDPVDRYQRPSEFVAACSGRSMWSRRAVAAAAVAGSAGLAGAIWWSARAHGNIRLAVLPFGSAAEADEHWADGLTDALIRLLRRQPGFYVVGRDSAFRFKRSLSSIEHVGSQLGVDWLVGGTVGRNGGEIQVHALLLRADGGGKVWSTTMRRREDEFGAVRLEIARQIAGQLNSSLAQATLETESLETNSEALEHYLKGRACWNRRYTDQLLRAREEFEKSLAADPNFPLAYCGLADVLSTLADFHAEPPVEALPKAKHHALTALSMNNRLADCYVSFAHATALNDGDWSTAEQSFRRALDIDQHHPLAHHWYSVLLMKLGHFEECLSLARALIRLDPLSISAYRNLTLMLYFARRYQEAIESARRVTDISPEHFGMHELVAECHARLGQRAEALREASEALKRQRMPGLAYAYAAVTYAILGERAQAEKLVEELSRATARIRFQPTHVARVWAELRQFDLAFTWLERAAVERDTMLQLLPTHASFDGLRLDIRYPGFLAKLRLTYPSK